MKPDESRTVYDGKLIDVTIERWGSHEREIVEHPGAVAIVAVDRGGFVTLVRQLREPARAKLVELPAGTREAGEEPLATAQRELREECGLTGGEWTLLTSFWTTPGVSAASACTCSSPRESSRARPSRKKTRRSS
jgi:NTP pyrophosphohydrolases including oxidative damage repair enzymes